MSPNEKLALPAFLTVLTAGGLSASRAMAVAGKIYKTHGTPEALANLSDVALVSLHVSDKEERKLVLAGIKKAGLQRDRNKLADPVIAAAAAATAIASKLTKQATPKKRKRESRDEYLPTKDEVKCGDFDFMEESDEKIIKTKVVHVNRAPVMTVWAMVVAERMGFKREEALSIASAYTELNATSKGISLGLFDEEKGKDTSSGGQPYVELMGRKVPVYSTRASQWRALLEDEPISPSSAFKYITHAFQQQAPHVVGAMRLLAETFAPKELNRVGFSLYADFRPHVGGWGKKGELTCSDILALRRATTAAPEEPNLKKQKSGLSVEEYEAALENQDHDGLFSDPEG